MLPEIHHGRVREAKNARGKKYQAGLLAEMMLRYVGSGLQKVWSDIADLLIKGMNEAISTKTVAHDFERLMRAEEDSSVKRVKCSDYADAVIGHM